MVNINKLLNKKSWSGKELGQLAIANLMLAYKKALETNSSDTELTINSSDFTEMLKTLKTPKEQEIYNGYIAIYNWVTKTMQFSISQEQQAQLQFNKLFNIVKNAEIAEDIYDYFKQIPNIMTEKQYSDIINKHTQKIINKDFLEENNDIAILKPNKFSHNHNIDKKTGYYISPDIEKILEKLSLEGLLIDYENNTKDIEDIRQTFISSLYFLKAFNTCLDLIVSMYDIEEVKIAETHVDFLENNVKVLNNTINILYQRVSNTEYKNKELKEKKLNVLKSLLYPIDLKKTTVPKKRIENTKHAMKNFRAFKEYNLNPANLLCIYDPIAIEEELKSEPEIR